ncbi:Vacuolar H+transporting two-sector ATPase F subunit [Pyrolobus fumarii 1A]|uniref:Vacuolar H+transporting two-sector ATPase F subunit n=1 Tax=Pyrolobus fumarii (strain DSM 11204 / 1A) TaxID=694429 RepID=G0EE15_PYRF1|nr:V-type ATP synthase subunit F [Pyrolobus fumarii]AEM37931.1 Vacuolar H+transporting two-sector ATPase F subunit [Pyrolobus fumarii 1A]
MPEKRIAVIADEYTATAFRLIGVEAYVAKDSGEARKILQKLLESTEVGVILVSNEYADAVKDIVEKIGDERSDVVVAMLPTLKSPGKPVDMRRLLLQALGFGG